MKNRYWWMAAILAAGLYGCSSDAASESKTDGETGGESGGESGGETGGESGGETGGETGGESGGETGGESGGETGGEPVVPPECDDVCEEGERICRDNGVWICGADENGCMAWEETEQCGENRHCDEMTLSCTDGCEVCDGQADRCRGDEMLKCVNDEAGCAKWEVYESCGEGRTCNTEGSACVNVCEAFCGDAPDICTGNKIRRCVPDENGCASYVDEPCPYGTKCSQDGLSCVSCVNGCEPEGRENCNRFNNLEKCSLDAQGCGSWTTIETCGAKRCDPVQLKCVEDECTAGERKCENNAVFVCTDKDGKKVWTKEEVCTKPASDNPETDAGGKMFSIVIIPDTQYYTMVRNRGDELYKKQMNWIDDNMEKYNIKAVIHVGDVTQSNDSNGAGEWKHAREAQDILRKSSIPHSIATGDHDYIVGNPDDTSDPSRFRRSRSHFGEYFGNDDYFAGKDWYHPGPWAGSSYVTFDAGGQHYMILALEYAPRKDVLCWADSVLNDAKYKDYHVIIETHSYLGHDGRHAKGAKYKRVLYGASGADVFKELAYRHSNVLMVVGGHINDSEYCGSRKNFQNHTIHEMVVNYQYEPKCRKGGCSIINDIEEIKGDASISEKDKKERISKVIEESEYRNGNGWLRLLEFNPEEDSIRATTHTVVPAGKRDEFFHSQKTDFYYPAYTGKKEDKDHNFCIACGGFSAPVSHSSISPCFGTNKDSYIGFGTRSVSDVFKGQQLRSSVAVSRSTGSWAAVWEDNENWIKGDASSEKNTGIRMGIFYPGGCSRLIDEKYRTKSIVVSNESGRTCAAPDAAIDNAGNTVVVWREDLNNTKDNHICIRGFNAAGKERFAKKCMETGKGIHRHPVIAMAPDGKFVIAWEFEAQGKGTSQIYLRWFNASGAAETAEKRVTSRSGNITGNHRDPDVAMSNSGQVVVTWESIESETDTDIMAARYPSAGTPQGEPGRINANKNGRQINPAIAMNKNGEYFIAYQDEYRSEDKKIGLFRIRVRGFNANGTETMSDRFISEKGHAAVDAAICLGDNTGYVTWTSDSSDKELGNNILKGKISRGGDSWNIDEKNKAYPEEFGEVLVIGEGDQGESAIGCTDEGDHVVLWSDDIGSDGYYDIYGRGFSKHESYNSQCTVNQYSDGGNKGKNANDKNP